MVSTPPIHAYSTKNVREKMIEQAQDLIDTDAFLRIDSKKQVIHLSKLFKIYSTDFGPSIEAILEWIIDAMRPGEKRDELLNLYYLGQFTVVYLPVDYSINIIREEMTI